MTFRGRPWSSRRRADEPTGAGGASPDVGQPGTTPPTFVRGTNDKPAASLTLIDALSDFQDVEGQLFVGYPIIASPVGGFAIDALYISPSKGIIIFDLVEGSSLGDIEDRQDTTATQLTQRLLSYKELVSKRQLQIPVNVITFAPAINDRDVQLNVDYPVVNAEVVAQKLASVAWPETSHELFKRALSAIQNISTIRRSRTTRVIEREDSRGAKLQRLESSISTLDPRQSTAVIETVDGVQRIRGLAGSGKTIVLALKAAYLHAQHPTWRIAVTFNTRSLKGQFKYFINNFAISSTAEEPDWTKVRVVNSWGAPGGEDRDGIFYEFCMANSVTYRDFGEARDEYGREAAFDGVCAHALAETPSPKALYDAILVDEAQDLPPSFLKMCWSMLDEHKRLVYAYDELQTLSGEGLPSAIEIFGTNDSGQPEVSFDQPTYDRGARRDIVLEKCYRNSRPVLVSAHGLGFGIYRTPTRGQTTGLVQMFDQPSLWTDIGYYLKAGELTPGSDVTLVRTEQSSPRFLEDHSPLDDLVQFIRFNSKSEQDEWIAKEIQRNVTEDELRFDDIIVINTDPVKTRGNFGPIRALLFEAGISSHLAGVDSAPDIFFKPGMDSVTFTGIYRAKGNEAGMVYIANADECQSGANLARLRNRLFTAITRSKAWVRVLGVGPQMERLMEEYQRIQKADFELRFRYPTDPERETLRVIHRDVTASEQSTIDRRRASIDVLIGDLEAGRIYPEDIDPETRERLNRLLKGANGT